MFILSAKPGSIFHISFLKLWMKCGFTLYGSSVLGFKLLPDLVFPCRPLENHTDNLIFFSLHWKKLDETITGHLVTK